MERTAWLAANIMNACGRLKRPISVERLLGRLGRKRKTNITLTPEEKKREFQKLLHEIEEEN